MRINYDEILHIINLVPMYDKNVIRKCVFQNNLFFFLILRLWNSSAGRNIKKSLCVSRLIFLNIFFLKVFFTNTNVISFLVV